MNISPTIVDLPDRKVAYIPFKGDYRGKPEVFASLFTKLVAWAAPQGLMDGAEMISSYNNDPGATPPEELLLDACLTLPDDAEFEGEGEVKRRTLKGGKYVVASLELTGPQEYEPAWNAIVKWIQDNGHEMNTDRSWYEIYKNDPNTHPKKHHLLDMCAAIN